MNHLIFEATGQNFEANVLQSALPVLIEFTADWCPPCKMLAPIINAIAIKYDGNLRVGLLDSDANQDIVQQYGVMGLPTTILFVDGVPVERIVGFTSQERIEAKILPHLAIENA
ncbi:MAG: thioredoxin domain-containing protein [Aggregatilineales bacterium]